MTMRLIAIALLLTMGLFGMAPAVLCAMPADCSMIPASAMACCASAPPVDGLQAASCRAETIPLATTPAVRDSAPSTPAAPLFAWLVDPAPPAAAPAAPHDASTATSPPRFLLTHTFRL